MFDLSQQIPWQKAIDDTWCEYSHIDTKVERGGRKLKDVSTTIFAIDGDIMGRG
jgi:hypothetical protein